MTTSPAPRPHPAWFDAPADRRTQDAVPPGAAPHWVRATGSGRLPGGIALGRRGEDLAAARLEAAGLVVVARNWRLGAGELRGELDLVAHRPRGSVLVVCEVKTRRSDRFGGPLVAVTPRKQARIRALTAAFLREVVIPHRSVRFDVIGIRVHGDGRAHVTHVEAAF